MRDDVDRDEVERLSSALARALEDELGVCTEDLDPYRLAYPLRLAIEAVAMDAIGALQRMRARHGMNEQDRKTSSGSP
jgi:hypothetical protein